MSDSDSTGALPDSSLSPASEPGPIERETVASMACPVCGLDSPHAHEDGGVIAYAPKYCDEVLRPAFESTLRSLADLSRVMSGLNSLPLNWTQFDSRTGQYSNRDIQGVWCLWWRAWRLGIETPEHLRRPLQPGNARHV